MAATAIGKRCSQPLRAELAGIKWAFLRQAVAWKELLKIWTIVAHFRKEGPFFITIQFFLNYAGISARCIQKSKILFIEFSETIEKSYDNKQKIENYLKTSKKRLYMAEWILFFAYFVSFLVVRSRIISSADFGTCCTFDQMYPNNTKSKNQSKVD